MKISPVEFDGLEISIEYKAGEVRTGKDYSGKEWSYTLMNDYGYIKGTHSPDGEHLDCYLAKNPKKNSAVYVIHQMTPNGTKYDEDKVMLGFKTLEDAKRAYKENTYKPTKMLGAVSEMTMDHFKVAAYQASNSKCFIGTERNYEIMSDKGFIPTSIKSPVQLSKKLKEVHRIVQGNRIIREYTNREQAIFAHNTMNKSIKSLYEVKSDYGDPRVNRIINEGLSHGDLEYLLHPAVSFDEYVDDSGEEINVVLAFFVRNVPEAVEPLRSFCDLAPGVVLTDTGDSETMKNTSIVYVEFKRKGIKLEDVINLIKEVCDVSNMNIKDLTVHFPKKQQFPFSKKVIEAYINQVINKVYAQNETR